MKNALSILNALMEAEDQPIRVRIFVADSQHNPDVHVVSHGRGGHYDAEAPNPLRRIRLDFEPWFTPAQEARFVGQPVEIYFDEHTNYFHDKSARVFGYVRMPREEADALGIGKSNEERLPMEDWMEPHVDQSLTFRYVSRSASQAIVRGIPWDGGDPEDEEGASAEDWWGNKIEQAQAQAQAENPRARKWDGD